MAQVIFSIDTSSKQVFLANNYFFKIFPSIGTTPYTYEGNEEIEKIVKSARTCLLGSDLGRIFVTKDGVVYSFDVDKLDENRLVISGRRYDSYGNSKDEEIYKLLKLLSNNLPDMLWAKDVEGKYIYANEAICKNLLMAEDTKEPIGKGDVFFALREREKHKDKKNWHTFGELCFDSDKVVLENMKPMIFEEYGNVKGKLLYLEVHKAPFFDEEGRLLGTVGSGRDITEEVIAKNKLKEKDQLLLQQSKMAAVGEMLQNIAHQWRQPLSSISTLSTSVLVQKEIGTLDDDYLISSMKNLNNNAQYLSRTIDDFRDFFKPNKEKTYFDFKELEDRVYTLISAKLKNNSIKIYSSLETIELYGYENEFMQVLINIINNSIDALIDTNVSEKAIFVKSKKKKDKFVIKIKDNAGGIPEDIINSIFEPYFTTKHQKQGTGIGLYMSEKIITKHMDGLISVKNKEFVHEGENCKGAEFKIVLESN